MTQKIRQKTSAKIVSYAAIAAEELIPEKIFNRCLNQSSAISSETGLSAFSDHVLEKLKCTTSISFHKSKSSLLSSYTLGDALNKAGWTQKELSNCGFIFATTTGQIDLWQTALPFSRLAHENQERIIQAAHRQSLAYSLSELQKHFQINGPSTLISSSCSASLQALAVATLWIRLGKVKRCIVGSTEILSHLTIQGFQCMRLLVKEIAKPFDKDRVGINLGEASSFFCIEADGLTNTKAHGWISGVGLSTDAYHPTAPHPEGKGSAKSIQQALIDSSLTAHQIDWVHAHGTGSSANDLAEFNALKTCFSEKIPFVTSTKPIHGHTLGTSGALESSLILEAFKSQKLPVTAFTKNLDSKIQLQLFEAPKNISIRHVLKNSLGFGGINASIILSLEKVSL